MSQVPTIIEALEDPLLFQPHFRGLETNWSAWIVLLKALFGLSMNTAEVDLFRQCTGRQEPRLGGHQDGYLVCGRRGGKSRILALIAVYLACFRDWRPYLAPGERATVMIIAADLKQARLLYRYCRALVKETPLLAPLVERETANELHLSNGVAIECQSATWRHSRGRSLVAALLDEQAFMRSEEGSANPDSEIIAALRPAMATIPGAMLLCASSPYARRGELYNAHRRWFGVEDAAALVWQAATKVMNPSVSDRTIADAYEIDALAAASEYGAAFRRDIDAFLSEDAVQACVVPGRRENRPAGDISYAAGVDPSGGVGDAFTCVIGHSHRDTIVIDAIREFSSPFNPDSVVGELASLLKMYKVFRIFGDRYAGEWPRAAFRAHGIEYRLNDADASSLLTDMLPLILSERMEIPDFQPRLVNQLSKLERRTSRTGKDSIAAPPGGHDDLPCALASLAKVLAKRQMSALRPDRRRPSPTHIPIFKK